MTIRRKALVIKLIGLACTLTGLSYVGSSILHDKFAEAEKHDTKLSVKRVTLNMNRLVDNLTEDAKDWGNYNASYKFKLDGDLNYIKKNITVEALHSQKVNMIAILDTAGSPVVIRVVDLKEDRWQRIPSDLPQALKRIALDRGTDGKPRARSGIIMLSSGPLMLASEPILASNKKEQTSGIMFFGVFLNTAQFSRVNHLTQVSASVYNIQGNNPLIESAGLGKTLNGRDIEVVPVDSGQVAGYTILNDMWGKPVLLLKVTTPRHIYQQGIKGMHTLFVFLLMFGVIVGAFELLLTENLVSKRLYRLSRDVGDIGTAKDQNRRLQVVGNDEIAQVSESVNITLDALELSQVELRENEHRLKSILDSVQIGVFLINPDDHTILDANIAALKMVGASKEELIGEKCHERVCSAHADSCPITVLHKNIDRSEHSIVRKDGSTIPILKTVVSAVLNGQTILIESFVDISDRIQAEEALRRAHDDLEVRVVERTAELAKANASLLYEIVEREQVAEKIYTRLRYEEGLAACSQALLRGGDRDDVLQVAADTLLLATGISRVYVFENFEDPAAGTCARQIAESCAEGIEPRINNDFLQHIPYEGSFSRWYTELSDGRPIMGYVSSLPKSEQAILLEQQIRTILVIPVRVGNIMYGFIGFDECVNHHIWNEYDVRMLFTAAEMIGAYIERNRAEGEILKANTKSEQLLLSISSALIVCDSSGEIHEWNKVAEELLGISPAVAINHSLLDIGLVWEDPEIPAAILEAIKNDEPANLGNVSIIRPDGASVTLMITTAPILDSGGNAWGCLLSGSDVTELRLLEVQLQHSQKLESIGQLAAGIAHEMNTPIQYVGDNTRFLQESFGPVLEVLEIQSRALEKAKEGVLDQEMLDEVESVKNDADIEYLTQQIPKATQQSLDGISRVARIVRAMKQFSHPGGTEHADEDLNGAIESTITVSKNEWKYVADLVTDFDVGLPLVPCMIADLNQVILNLIVNAAHAIGDAREKSGSKEKGIITVSTRQNGDWAEIRVSDTGLGIPESIRQRVFEPFFTTKKIGIGTGQGLALARSIVTKMHNGNITFESKEGEGSTFIIQIPLLTQTA